MMMTMMLTVIMLMKNEHVRYGNTMKTRKIRLRAVDWYASALSHTALLPKSLI